MNFFDRVKSEIKKQNTTQEWVASQAGVSFQTFRGWISKGILPRVNQGTAIAKALGVTTEYLVSGESLNGDLLFAQIQGRPKLRELAEAGSLLSDSQLKVILTTANALLETNEQSQERHA